MARGNKYIVCRDFFLTIVSAENLPDVREVFKTRAYAKISIRTGTKKIKFRTDPDRENGLNPNWNHSMAYQIAESGVLYYGLAVVIKVYCQRSLGDRYIGEVHTTMKELFDHACNQGGNAKLSLPIVQGNTGTGGKLHFYYSFGQRYSVPKRDFKKKLRKFGIEIMMEVAKQAVLFAILPTI